MFFELDQPLYRGKSIDDNKWLYGYFFKDEKASYIINGDDKREIIPETLGIYVGESAGGIRENAYSGDIIIGYMRFESICLSWCELGIIHYRVSNLTTDISMEFAVSHYYNMPHVYTVIGNIFDNKLDFSKVQNKDMKTAWLKSNLHEKDSPRYFADWCESSYSEEELKVLCNAEAEASKKIKAAEMIFKKEKRDYVGPKDLELKHEIGNPIREKALKQIAKMRMDGNLIKLDKK